MTLGVAPWPQPPSLRTWTAALVPPTSTPVQRGQTYCPADPPCVGQETQKDPTT